MGSSRLLALAILLGAAAGGFLAYRLRRAEPASKTPDSPSWYLRRIRPAGLEVEEMAPVLVSPRRSEAIPAACPPALVLLSGEDSYATHILPWLKAMRLEFPLGGTVGVALGAAESLTRAGRDLLTIAGGPVGTPPMRILARHYPRPELPGRCFTIVITIAPVVDPWFDNDLFAQQVQRAELRPELRGMLLEIRKTYQDERGDARLVEARVQLQEHLRLMPAPIDLPELAGDERVRAVGSDGQANSHHAVMGGGERIGLVWYDLAAGRGNPDPWSAAYSISYADPARPPTLVLDKASPGQIEALLRVARES